MGERLQLFAAVKAGASVSEAAHLFGVSRKTAHKWIARAESEGTDKGLEDKSRARLTQERFEGRAVDLMLRKRQQHPGWGPRTLLHWVRQTHPKLRRPAPSTLGDILRREGLLKPRSRRKTQPNVVGYRPGDTTPAEPNDRWTIDFKGDFKLGNGTRCYPLTLRDAVSRMLLRIDAFESVAAGPVHQAVAQAFSSFGLPKELHSDTGTPFGSPGLARLSRLSVFAIKHGVRPVFSRPGKPQDNGGHERMHRDLKAETTRPPGANLRRQQQRFDAFRCTFNDERPHHALAGATPRSRWRTSSRVFPSTPPEPNYPLFWETRSVDASGRFSWKGHLSALSKVLHLERVGFEPLDEGLWRIHFYDFVLGLFDERRPTPQVVGLNAP